jgi:hypothetical protein
MDYPLIALIGVMIAIAVVGGMRPRRPGWQYQRVFSAGFVGLLFLVAGLIGWDLKYSRGWFEGTKWVDGPIWWQVSLGAGLLLLAVFWARRVPSLPSQR